MRHLAAIFYPSPLVAALALTSLLAACDPGTAGLAQARHYRGIGQPEAAVAELNKLVQGEPGQREAHRMLGELYLEQGELLLAEQALRRTLLLGAGDGRVTLLLGRTLLMQGQYARLLREIDPMSPPALRPATLCLRASAAFELGDFDAASAMFDQALSLEPESPEALLGLARIALRQHQPILAQHLLAQALATHPAHPELLRFGVELAP